MDFTFKPPRYFAPLTSKNCSGDMNGKLARIAKLGTRQSKQVLTNKGWCNTVIPHIGAIEL